MGSFSTFHWIIVAARFFLCGAVTFIPTYIAYLRDIRKRRAVLLINFFLWIVIGWFVALAWAIAGERMATT